jgi:hypothetical protein
MIISEAMLAPHRKNGGSVSISGGSQHSISLPVTYTTDAFCSDWSAHREPGSRMVSIEKLEVVLVLAFTINVPILKPDREWVSLYHQCGGGSCECQTMLATRLTPRAGVLPTLRSIAREGFGAETGHFDRHQVLASRIAAYVAALRQIGLDCEASWRYLTESLYPVDARQDNLDRIAENAPDLETMVEWRGYKPPLRGYLQDPVIFFVTENSD